MADSNFRLRPLHRQRSGRRKTVQVLDHEELAVLLGVTPNQLKRRLQEIGWRFHEDSAGRIWATPQNPPPMPRSHGTVSETSS